MPCYRKSRNGSITTTATLGVNTSSSLASGLLGMPFINSIEMNEVAELAKEQSGLNPGHPRFLGALPKCGNNSLE